jgi:hypothetical protein
VLARLAVIFPFLLAVLLPPAGLLIGLSQLQQDRDLGIRLIVVSALAAVVWVLLFVA